MPMLCSGCGRPPASKTAQRCTYCGASFANAPSVAPANALNPQGAASPGADVPFPDDTPVPAAPGDPFATPPSVAAGGSAGGAPERAARARSEWPSSLPAPPPPPLPGARPAAKLSPEARAILEAKVPPLWQQVLMAPFATRARSIGFTVVAIILLSILGLNRVIESSRPKETARGPAIEVKPGGGIVPVMPDPDFALQGDRARVLASASNAATQALEKIADALRRYGDAHSGLPERLSSDLRELREVEDLSGQLAHFAPDSFQYRHFTRLNLENDSGEVSALAKGGSERVTVAVEWTRKTRSYSGSRVR